MFKLKVSIYMKSGNVIYIRVKNFAYRKLSGSAVKEIQWEKGNFKNMTIDCNEIEGIIVKDWWAKWG